MRLDLPPDAPAGQDARSLVAGSAPAGADRPWPLVVLLGLGGWLAALPLLGVLTILLGDDARHKPVLLITIGAALIACAVLALRKLEGRVLIEQSAFPTLLAGGGLLGWGLYEALPDPLAAVLLALAAAATASCVPQRWLVTVLGAAGGAILPFAADGHSATWWAIQHANIAIWLAAPLLLRRPGTVHDDAPMASSDSVAPGTDAWFAGWLACTLAGLCAWSGTSFMAGGLPLPGLFADGAGTGTAGAGMALAIVLCVLSVALAIAAAAVAARELPALRQPWCAGVALTLLVFTWFMPALGGVLLVLAGCLVRQHYRIATAAGLAAAWVIGSAYYQLTWTLNQKAAVFALAGLAIVALAWRALLAPQPDASPLAQPAAQPAASPRRAGFGIAACLLAVLVVANASIWRNEDLLANSETVFVELAPVDPRSLLQGDFMRLAVRLPAGLEQANGGSAMAIGVRDRRGVVRLERLDDGRTPGPGELRIALTRKDGRWILASDAWFFQEGDAKRFENARYGEYRVRKDGRALLTGLRGAALEKL